MREHLDLDLDAKGIPGNKLPVRGAGKEAELEQEEASDRDGAIAIGGTLKCI